jgi:hypothetical protein
MDSKSIGERAAEVIRDRAKQERTTIEAQCLKVNATRKAYHDWNKMGWNPTAYFLQQMALAGYDVIYILTGEKKNEN